MNKIGLNRLVYIVTALIIVAGLVLMFTAGVGANGEFAAKTRYSAKLPDDFNAEGLELDTLSADVSNALGLPVFASISTNYVDYAHYFQITGPQSFVLDTQTLTNMLTDKYPTIQLEEFTSTDVNAEYSLNTFGAFALAILAAIVVAYVVSMLSVGASRAVIVLVCAIVAALFGFSLAVLSRTGNFGVLVIGTLVALASAIYFTVAKLSAIERYVLKAKKADGAEAIRSIEDAEKPKNLALVILCSVLAVAFSVVSFFMGSSDAFLYGILIALTFLYGLVVSRTLACDMCKKFIK